MKKGWNDNSKEISREKKERQKQTVGDRGEEKQCERLKEREMNKKIDSERQTDELNGEREKNSGIRKTDRILRQTKRQRERENE